MSIPALLVVQVAISLLVVTLYHLWVGRKKQSAPVPQQPAPVVQQPVPVPQQPAPVAPVVVAPVVATPPKAPPAVETVSPEILAVIAAAIAVILDRPHRVVFVRPATALAPEGNAWAIEGRVEQFQSHRFR
jgi:hypothetical protein